MNKDSCSNVEINGNFYEWASIEIPLVSKKTFSLIKLANKKGIELLYGINDLPVSLRFNNPNEKIHFKTLERIKQISRHDYFLINN